MSGMQELKRKIIILLLLTGCMCSAVSARAASAGSVQLVATASLCRSFLNTRFGAEDSLPAGKLLVTERKSSGYPAKTTSRLPIFQTPNRDRSRRSRLKPCSENIQSRCQGTFLPLILNEPRSLTRIERPKPSVSSLASNSYCRSSLGEFIRSVIRRMPASRLAVAVSLTVCSE